MIFLYGQGISREGEIIDLGVQEGFIEKSGSWYAYGGKKIGQGKDNVRQYLIDNPKVAEEVMDKIKVVLMPKKGPAVEEAVEAE